VTAHGIWPASFWLQEDPASHEPVSLLGFDAVLSMPSLEDFSKSIKLQKRTLKALLLDQVSTHTHGHC